MSRRVALLLLLVGAGLAFADAGSPRSGYNSARAAYEKGELDEAERGFLAARDSARGDGELRSAAAFNLGMTFARRAEGLGEKPEEALAALRQAAAWFRDALRLRAGDEDARANLELVLLRAQDLADKINHGQNGLEARLDRLLEEQRALRDRLRELVARIGVGQQSDPQAFAEEFRQGEAAARALLAELGTVADLAVDEATGLEQKKEAERSAKERVRLAQLGALERHLGEARTQDADARRQLARLVGERAQRAASRALSALKRAREQLLDPVAVLAGIGEEQAQTLAATSALEAFGKGAVSVTPGGPAARAPVWLTADLVAEEEAEIARRTGELLARLDAGSAAPPADPAAGGDPAATRMIEAARGAVPHLRLAEAAMGEAKESIVAGTLDRAGAAELRALEQLAAAAELFAELRQVIELTAAEQRAVVTLLDPLAEPSGEASPAGAKPSAPLTTEERTAQLLAGLARNRGRLVRLERLLIDEQQAAAARAAQAAQAAQPGAPGQPAPAADDAGQAELFRRAEELRVAALTALARTEIALAARRGEPLPAAREVNAQLEELRRLFFSIVEHLKELHAHQTETHDESAAAQAEAKEAERVGPLGEAQARHLAMVSAIAQALEEQGAAAQVEQGAEAAEAGKQLDAAAVEVRGAESGMHTAAQTLAEAALQAATSSPDFALTLAAQAEALERLANAIRLLAPPEQQEQQQQEQQPKQEQQEAERKLREIREREAARENQKRERRRTQDEPVERDW